MKHNLLLSVFCIVAMSLHANAQPLAKHSVGATWSCLAFNSTYSKNSDKKTFGTIGINYGYHLNDWITATGNIGWSHSWFGSDADPAYAYPKKDNAVLLLAGYNVSWFQKGMLQLYHGIAGGVDIRVQKNDRGYYTTMELAGQFDAIGLKYDWTRAYINISAGWGSSGCIRFGAGFNF